MDAILRKRSLVIAGHATSVTLEGVFWDELKRIAQARDLSINQLAAEIDGLRQGNLSSALRVFVVSEIKRSATEVAEPKP
jgi:predicted DNA-binding ribbon-helix-helix protein